MSTEPAPQVPCCVGIGEVLWDLLPTGKALGGAPANVIAHAAQLGTRGTLVSAVGDDPAGREIVQRLHALNVETAGIQVVRELPTGMVDVKLDDAGVPTFAIRAPAAWDALAMDAALEQLAAAADAVVFGSLAQRDERTRGAMAEFLRAVRPGCLKVFDVNLRPPFVIPGVIRDGLQQADLLKLNDAELPVVAEIVGLAGDESAQLRALLEKFELRLVVYTRGSAGSRMLTPQWDESHPGYRVKPVDTVGAGDAFTAVVTVGMLRGGSPSRIQELANRVAAFVCSEAGAVPRLPVELAGAFQLGSARDQRSSARSGEYEQSKR